MKLSFFKNKKSKVENNKLPVQKLAEAPADPAKIQARLDRKLYRAVKKKQHADVSALLARGANPNTLSKSGLNAFHKAVEMNEHELAALLLQYGAHINLPTRKYGNTALHIATPRGDLRMMENILKDADPNVRNKKGDTPLHLAVRGGQDEDLETVQSLLWFFEADPNLLNHQGKAPLHLAAKRGEYEMIQELLEKGVDINLQTGKKGKTALHICIEEDHLKIIDELLTEANPNIKRFDNGNTPLHTAVKKEDLEVLEALLVNKDVKVNTQNHQGETALFMAVKHDEYEMVEVLLEAEADLNLARKDGMTPLHAAVKKSNLKMIDELMVGANPNSHQHHTTPLHTAILLEDLELTEQLLFMGADPNFKDANGDTPLHLAVRNGEYEIAEELLKEWANPGIENYQNENPFDIAKRGSDPLLKLLQKSIAQIKLATTTSDSTQIKEITFYLRTMYRDFLDKKFSVEMFSVKLHFFMDRINELYPDTEVRLFALQCANVLMFFADGQAARLSLPLALQKHHNNFIEEMDILRLKATQKETRQAARKLPREYRPRQTITAPLNYPELHGAPKSESTSLPVFPSIYQDYHFKGEATRHPPVIPTRAYEDYSLSASEQVPPVSLPAGEVEPTGPALTFFQPPKKTDEMLESPAKETATIGEALSLAELIKALPDVPIEEPVVSPAKIKKTHWPQNLKA